MANKIEANKIEANKMEANKMEANKMEANKIEANKIEAVKPIKKRTKKIEKAEKQPAEKQPAEKQPAEKQPTEQKSTVSIVLIETNGTIKTLKTKEITEDTLYKKCGFRVSDDFLCRHTWTVKLKNITEEPMTISVWAKKTGKANFENKYDMPPPLDKELFFGTCAIVRTASDKASSKSTFLDLTKETWLKIYEQLFGGFEDIGEEDEYSEDELENVDPKLLTSHGYLKDGFVVSDKEVSASTSEADASEADASEAEVNTSEAEADTEAEASASEADAEASEADAEPEVVVKKKVVKKVAQKVAQKKIGKVKAKKQVVEEEEYKDDTSELEEEVYTFSDDD